MTAERLRRLEAVCLRDMVALAGLGGSPGGGLALRLACGGRVRRFARAVAAYDVAVEQVGVARAARRLARRYGGEIVATGSARVPASGPVLIVANHPGLFDTLAVYATAPRPDLFAVSRPQPLLSLLPAMERHLLLVPDAGPDRASAIRALLRRLREGGAALLFPSGRLEPEPDLLNPGADPLADWSPGFGMLVRLAARHGVPLCIVPAAISGTLSEQIWRRFWPLIRLRRTPQARADLATLLQLVFPRLGATTVRVEYGEPIDGTALAATGLEPAELASQIREELSRLLVPLRSRGRQAACAW